MTFSVLCGSAVEEMVTVGLAMTRDDHSVESMELCGVSFTDIVSYQRQLSTHLRVHGTVYTATVIEYPVVTRLKIMYAYTSLCKPVSKLPRSVTCHMGSHSTTCHPTQVNAPHLNPSQIGRYAIYLLGGMKG